MTRQEKYKEKIQQIKTLGLPQASRYGTSMGKWIYKQGLEYHLSGLSQHNDKTILSGGPVIITFMEQWKIDLLESIPGWKEKYGMSLMQRFVGDIGDICER